MIELTKKDIFLKSMEDWVNEIVVREADDHNSSIPGIIEENYCESMRANVDFHKEISEILTREGDTTLAAYHDLMAAIYTGLATA